MKLKLMTVAFVALMAAALMAVFVPSVANAQTNSMLVAQHSQKCAEVEGASLLDGADVIQWTCHGGPNQRWTLHPVDGGYYQIRVQHSGKCLDVDHAFTHDGADVIQWRCVNGAREQHWRPEPVGGGYYQIRARHSGKCLDVDHAFTHDGADVIQWRCVNGAREQHWQFR